MTTAYTEEDETPTSQDKTNKNLSELVEKNPTTEENHEGLKIIESNCTEEKERNSSTLVENERNDVIEETRREEFSEQQRTDSRPKKYVEEMNHVHAEKPQINLEECKTIVELVNVENLCSTFQECSFEFSRKTNETQDDDDDDDDNNEFDEEEKRRNNNDTLSVRKLIDNCESYSNGVEENYNPEESLNFHEAVRAGDAKVVAMLIKNGEVTNLDEPDWNVSGDPPLLVAATNHCLPVLSTLLLNGCDPAVRSPRGETALHRAILNGGPGSVLKFVGELLKYGCPPGVKEAGGGLTALHVLTRQLAHAQSSKSLHHDFEAALKTLDLLAKAGPVNAKDHHGRSALHILASSTTFDNNHRTEIESLIATLLEAGADPALRNDRGETPLHECLECGALNTAILLIPHTPVGITSRYGETPLHIAARKNHTEMVAKLLEHGEDPGLQDAGGNTPLHLASARGFHQIVSFLVTSPLAQLEKINADGLTALQVAAESGFVNAVKLLLQAGADPSHTEHYSPSTLHRHPDILTLIDHELTRRRQLAA